MKCFRKGNVWWWSIFEFIYALEFIDDLIEYRLDEIEIDIYIDKKKYSYYSIDIDTKMISRTNNALGLSILTQRIHFCVCPETGLVTLSRDDYNDYKDTNIEFAKKYAEIITNANDRLKKDALDKIIDNSYKDLKLKRESNIRKLIG